ncbi:MAG: N-carbamoylputrescine amidase [Gammaproteobacteria bacterium]
MATVTFAATQMACDWDTAANLNRGETLVRDAAAQGAQVVLLQELFETPYFCKDEDPKYFDLARSASGNEVIERFGALALELEVVLPISFFERSGNSYFNSLAMIDADGSCLGIYRKSHIPDSPGYSEKFYFSPGDTGFKIWNTRYGRLGVAICWDQWFPEAARAMALMGAEALLYPTAIGSEPSDETMDSKGNWQRVMQGHAAANVMPVIASNRIGIEEGESCSVTFYGSSFIADHTGAKIAEAGRDDESVLTASFDMEAVRKDRVAWGVYRDRRPDLYKPLMSLDSNNDCTTGESGS